MPVPVQPTDKRTAAMRAPRLLWLMIALLPLTACTWSGGTVTGKVLEEGTEKPMADVIITVTWNGQASSLVDSHRVCVHVDSTVTGSNGRYRFNRWIKPARFALVSDIEPSIIIHKPGYVWQTPDLSKDSYLSLAKRYIAYLMFGPTNYLAPFTGTREERLEYLKRMAMGSGCHEAGESEKDLYPLYEALYFEAKALAVTEADRKDLQWLRELAAAIAVGISDQLTHAENEKRIEQFLQGHLK